MRLSPYLNVKQVSPKKQKEMLDYIEQKIIKADKGPHKVLKRMKIQKNKILGWKALT